uniref:R-linalool synthase QH1, chloroplastic-like n=1 Tax=Erigeron canadensis TaxID=72917 RepID=UPI001CB9D65F|nr:R-linalool synthase QH1, chloroplastic-like [Erigeron canadensis]
MASVYLFIGPVIRKKSSVVTYTSRFDICKPLCSSNSTSSSSMGVDTAVNAKPLIVRRSANYQPSLWSFDHVQSLTSRYTGEDIYATRAHVLKEEVKAMLPKDTTNVGNPLIKTLELVDDLQRLGISYHFEEDIRNVLEMIYHDYYKRHESWNEMDLNLKSLGFRLLRQHGYQVPQDIFHNFMDEIQNLKPQSYEDMVSLLNLYEASYHSFEDESILDNVRDFTTRYLQENLENMDQSISLLVSHALELPLHWRVPRVEAKWFIQVYDQKRNGMNPTLIELARMDFNIVQTIHLEDLKDSSRWWRNMKWDQKLCFARDRLVENFLWTIGVSYLPHFSYGRRVLTKVNALITTIDDIYDVYGTLDELEKFTDVIDRWDINAIDELPDYMKICFHGFYNTINEIAYNTLTDTGFHSLPFLKQAWTDLCKAYLVEAKWFHNRHAPTLEEYLDNACVSISAHVTLMHFNFLASTTSSAQIGQCMERADNIVRCSAQILRLSDDLGTSADEMERGDNSKSIQCYMHDTGGTEDEARTYLHELIMITWKKLNKERALCDNSQISREFIECATNIARMSQFMYGHGDWHGRPDDVTINHVLSLLCDPIQEI